MAIYNVKTKDKIMKIYTKALIVLILTSFSAVKLNAQCGMDHVHEEWKKANLGMEKHEVVDSNFRYVPRRNEKIIIPVVFHVMHTNGGENISEAQIADQMRIINEDFNMQNSDVGNVRNTLHAPFAPLVADFEIEFVLAKKDPKGNCTNGINRVYTNLNTNVRNEVKDIVRWPVERYLNIWVVSSINSANADGTVLGFANFPWMPHKTDGIVMLHNEVGMIGTGNVFRRGRTLTHEIGHYIGLFHPFQGGCTLPNDRVDDTPFGESAFATASCGQTFDSCPEDTLFDQWENYMDYSFGCQVMFTKGQKERAYFYLTSPNYTRRNLYSAENLEFTGITSTPDPKPLAHFRSNKRTICAGQQIQFFNNSCQGLATTLAWEFEGANTPTSAAVNPIVIYDTPGKYKVKLTATNGAGTSEYEEEQYIWVYPQTASLSGFSEDFEVENSFALAVAPVTSPGYSPFVKTNTAGHSGNSSIVANNNLFNTGERFCIETPPLNLSLMSGSSPKLSFMVAHARRNTTNNDIIRIYSSEDCGATFQQRFVRNSAQFASYDGFALGFVPKEESDWARLDFPLTAFQNSNSIMFRIEVESAGGNPVYIDDINISQFYTSVNLIENSLDFVVYPNPTEQNFTVQVKSLDSENETTVTLLDINGREVVVLYNDVVVGELLELNVDTKSNNLTAGIYLIRVRTRQGVVTKKLIVTN